MKRGSGVPDFDCLVIGSGIIGSTMASLLIARRLVAPGRVAVIADRAVPMTMADAPWDLRVFALSRASQRLFDLCGIWQALPPGKMNAYERMCVWDARGEPRGPGSLTFDGAELGEPNLGYIVEARALQTQCVQAARTAGAASIVASVAGIAVDGGGARVSLLDGRELTCQLVIAADGTDSAARGLLGIETAGHAYSQDALVAHVSTVLPHANTAWQRFLDTGPLAFLPLPDGRSSIVWSAARADAARLLAMEPAAFAAALTAASGGVLGECRLTTPVVSVPLKLQYALDYVRPRAVLLGDAAHVVHPLAGQGLNLGLLDCACLAAVLGDAGAGGFFGEHKLLRRYERWRRADNLAAATGLDLLERLFASANPVVAQLRLRGLGAVGGSPFIKRRLAARALGLAGDVPEFLTGGPPSPRR